VSALDLLAASLGLAASALAAAMLLPLWRRAPVPAYRLAVCVLTAALALPLLQWGARAIGLPVPHPVGALARAWVEEVPAAAAVPEQDPMRSSPAALDPTLGSVGTGAGPETGATRAAGMPLPWRGMLLAVWVAGASAAMWGTMRRLLATRALFARARPVTDEVRLSAWNAVRADSRLGARTRLCESDELRTPACAGLLRPVVVLPADDALALRPELLACVLTHELVHLERRDPWVMLGEELLRAAFWFHPAAWWLVARLDALRELSCDCLVVRRTGKRKRYASALVEYATWMQRSAARATWAAVVPWSESRGHLTRRIEMLLQPEPETQSRRIVAPAAVGVLMTFLWSGQLALATSSCAGTRAEHAHEHRHEHVHATCETKAATSEHVAVHADGQPAAEAPSHEREVIVLRGGEGKVVKKGDAAAEIEGAWRAAAEGEPQVIVIGPDGEKRFRALKRTEPPAVEGQGKARHHGGVWRFHKTGPDGQVLHGRIVPPEGFQFDLQFDHGQWAELGKVYGEKYKQGFFGAHGAPKHAEGMHHLFGRAAGGDGDLDALRRELEETRAALEEQRQALEELRRQLEEQRARKSKKTETVGALMR
jgi:beta-lactamase regulating signal transducer with metallopeptidase domain